MAKFIKLTPVAQNGNKRELYNIDLVKKICYTLDGPSYLIYGETHSYKVCEREHELEKILSDAGCI